MIACCSWMALTRWGMIPLVMPPVRPLRDSSPSPDIFSTTNSGNTSSTSWAIKPDLTCSPDLIQSNATGLSAEILLSEPNIG